MSETKPDSPLKRKLLPLEDTRKVTGVTKGAFRRLFSGVRSEREESFEQAKQRLDWSENDIEDFVAYRRRESYIYAGLTAIAFLFACGSPYSSSPMAHLITSLAVMLMVGSRLLVAHFRLTQLRHRALYSFREYLGLFFAADNRSGAQGADHGGTGHGETDELAKVVELTKSQPEK